MLCILELHREEGTEFLITFPTVTMNTEGSINDESSDYSGCSQGFDSPYPEMLTNIEDAAFNGDEEGLDLFIQEALDG